MTDTKKNLPDPTDSVPPAPNDPDAWEAVLTKALRDAAALRLLPRDSANISPSVVEPPTLDPIAPDMNEPDGVQAVLTGAAKQSAEKDPLPPRRNDLEKAIALALEAHAGQTDLIDAPYILHPLAVMFQVGSDPILQQAAVLHDVLENSDTTALTLVKAGIVPAAIALVKTLTHGADETYEAYIARIKAAGPAAIRIKVADLEHNLSRMQRITNPVRRDQLTKKYAAALAALKAVSAKASAS